MKTYVEGIVSGTTGQYAKFTGAHLLGNSLLSEAGTTVTVGGALRVGTLGTSVPITRFTSQAIQNLSAADLAATVPTSQAVLDLVDRSVPPGTVMAYASSVVPAGWRECNGSSLDGSTAAFADLFTAIGKRFGAGNGSASGFNVPDLRGKFIRGWSHGSGWDPDAGSRTNSFGGNTGDNVGSYQGDGYASHNHPFSASGTTGTESQYHSHKTFSLSWGWRTLSEVSLSGGGPYDNIVYGLSISSTPGGYTSSGENVTHTHSINLTNQATNYTGGSETRPKNVYLMYIIKL